MTNEDALEWLKARFPFKGYVDNNTAPYFTVGDVIRKYLNPGDRLFDLGSGPCDKTAIAQAMGIQCTAVDDLADDWHKTGDNVMRIEKFAREVGITFSRKFEPLQPDTFDMIMMNDVLEHIHDSPREILVELVRGLKPGGYLFFSVPNLANIRKRLDLLRGRTNLPRYPLYYWYKGVWRGPQREYVRNDLVLMCEFLGVEIVELYTVHHMLQNLSPAFHPAYKLVTIFFPDWRDTWILIARKPKSWHAKTELSETEFAEIYGTVNKKSLYS
ncbi:MAG: class I SAM-dependent methyltransferase [Rhizobiaceae bacterium]